MKVWITAEPWPATPEVEAAAAAAGAEAIWHGIPASRADEVPAGTTGLYELAAPAVPEWAPLDATGALATLLVVTGALELVDAANAIHEEPAHLVAEAEAWSIAP